jgi:hypothetical protein
MSAVKMIMQSFVTPFLPRRRSELSLHLNNFSFLIDSSEPAHRTQWALRVKHCGSRCRSATGDRIHNFVCDFNPTEQDDVDQNKS